MSTTFEVSKQHLGELYLLLNGGVQIRRSELMKKQQLRDNSLIQHSTKTTPKSLQGHGKYLPMNFQTDLERMGLLGQYFDPEPNPNQISGESQSFAPRVQLEVESR